jgi:hypothetical protein
MKKEARTREANTLSFEVRTRIEELRVKAQERGEEFGTPGEPITNKSKYKKPKIRKVSTPDTYHAKLT